MATMVGTTVSSMEEARKIAAACVEAKLAACAHIDEINSMFFWDGKVQDEKEFRVFLKTTESSYDEIAKIILQHHSYEEPAIFCIPITHGSVTYLKWIDDNSTPVK
ncbi:divalent-cation tolerance protein CutA [Hoeflea alexandrii]|uniref:divalent-cation tolerance protein CutA n=1 Tax=Hoeflea alexandrii TaxID=288436 RepID=UPI0022B04E70|nr:divalent-cation tolerance protein CutA [Hoeflea alexandrii]MCZ4291941.1 divalent-cation tolerance protein CutA [Hoeflea alexandrii]